MSVHAYTYICIYLCVSVCESLGSPAAIQRLHQHRRLRRRSLYKHLLPWWPAVGPENGEENMGQKATVDGFEHQFPTIWLFHSHGESTIPSGFNGKILYKWAIFHHYVK